MYVLVKWERLPETFPSSQATFYLVQRLAPFFFPVLLSPLFANPSRPGHTTRGKLEEFSPFCFESFFFVEMEGMDVYCILENGMIDRQKADQREAPDQEGERVSERAKTETN